MRRKSERTKEKDKPSPEKKSEKATRRSRRQARKKRRSVSSSPERNESGAEENETSVKSSQEDTEEEQVVSVDETSCQVGAVITADLASTSEVEEENQSVSVKSRKLKKHLEEVSADEEKAAVTPKCETFDSEWKEDNTFWEENEAKPESSEHKHKEKEGKSSVWKVKSADGGGGEIQKLKLCIVRPQEPVETSLRKKKRLRRSSGSQQKEKSDIDDNESGKGSQEDDEKLSSDERSSVPKPSSDLIESGDSMKKVEEETNSCTDMTKSELVKRDEGKTEMISESDEGATKENAELCIENYNDGSGEGHILNDTLREDAVQGNNVGDSADSGQCDIEREKESGIEEQEEEKVREPSYVEEGSPVDKQSTVVKEEQGKDLGSTGDASPRSSSSEQNIMVEDVPFSRDEEQSTTAINEIQCPEKDIYETPEKGTSENMEKDGADNMEKDTCEIVEKDANGTEEKDANGTEEKDANGTEEKNANGTEEKDANGTEEKDANGTEKKDANGTEEKDANGTEEKGASGTAEKDASEDSEKDVCEDPNILSLTTDEIVTDDLQPRIEASDLMCDSVESKSRDDPFELKNVPSSPEEQRNSNNDGDVLKLQEGSSDDEKEDIKGRDSKEHSPHFRERRHESHSLRERESKSPEQSKDLDPSALHGPAKYRRRFERRSRSPQRREKISLKRSFSGRRKEAEQNDSAEYSDTIEKISFQDSSNEESARGIHSELDATYDNSGANMPRKRRWGQSNRSRPSKKPVLSISTDSLKTLIPGAKPVPIGEVQLITEDEVKKEFELWESEREIDKEKQRIDVKEEEVEKKTPVLMPDTSRISVAVTDDQQSKIVTRKISIVSDDARTLQKSPSPPRHKVTNILFITNLVRPFTVHQLKELLARTGKINEASFWIDKIKSKCYVEYETETEAKETRHALHGVRWPVSNPKTLCVDFGKKDDMELARAAAELDQIPRKTEPLKVERTVEGWVVDQTREKDREREIRDRGREVERERERPRGKDRIHSGPVDVEHNKKVAVREWDLGKIGQTSPTERETRYDDKREKERKVRKERGHRSRSVSPHEPPVRKAKKKEEDAPAKLLDDLFRKTKSTPCIYWLPLNAEQIVVKEEMRRKHMAEHERRMEEMRKAERERERVRAQQRQQRRASERVKRKRRSGSGSPKK